MLTVAALEPINNKETTSEPSTSVERTKADYRNIYNYLSAITRGSEPPELNITEAAILLDIIENLIRTLSKSQTLIQREFLHSEYKELRRFLNTTDKDSNSTPSDGKKKKFHFNKPIWNSI